MVQLWPEPGLEECQSCDEKGRQGNPKVSVALGSSRGTSGELEARFERQFIQATWFAFSTSF